MSDGLGGLERHATVASLVEALGKAPPDAIAMVNRVGNINVYSVDDEWLAIINLEPAWFEPKEPRPPRATWEPLGALDSQIDTQEP